MSEKKSAGCPSETGVCKHITSDDNSPIAHAINYYEVAKILENQFGIENILVLPYEMFKNDKKTFLDNFSNFMSTSFESSVYNISAIENPRSAKDVIKRHDNITTLFGFSKYFPAMLKFKVNLFKNPGEIKLTEKEKNTLFEQYKDSNKKLSDRYQLSLDDYGYY